VERPKTGNRGIAEKGTGRFGEKAESSAGKEIALRGASPRQFTIYDLALPATHALVLPAFLTTILFSVSAVCAQRTSKELGGAKANLLRLFLATFFLSLWAHTRGKGFSGPAFPIFLLSGLFGFGLGDAALYQTLPRLGSRLSILLVHCLAAPFAAATEWVWLGTRMTFTQIAAATLILSGVALALAPGRHLQISRRTFWIGIALGAFAAFGQALGAVLSRHANQVAENAHESIDGLTAAYQRIWAGLAVGIVFWALTKRRGDGDVRPANNRPRVWPWVLVNALSGPALGVGCYQWALLRHGTGVVLPIVALTPLVIIPFSHYVEGERPRKRSLAGGAIAVVGVFLLTGGLEFVRRELKSF
jgi:drug/metabolite transporter (DMT)-like permease